MLASILTLLLKPLQWLTKNPKVALGLIVVIAFAYGWHEHGRAEKAQASATKSAAAIIALQDTTKLYRGLYERTVVQLDSLPKKLAALYPPLAKGEKPVAGVVITTREQAATNIPTPVETLPSVDPVKSDTAAAEIDTLGVHVGIRIADQVARWNLIRHPTTLTLEFVRTAKDSILARARSSDGAALDLSPPFLIQSSDPVAKTGNGWTFWAMLAGDAILVAKLLIGFFR